MNLPSSPIGVISVVGFGGRGLRVVVVVGRGEVGGRLESTMTQKKKNRTVNEMSVISEAFKYRKCSNYLNHHQHCILHQSANHNEDSQSSNVVRMHNDDLAIDHVRTLDMHYNHLDGLGSGRCMVHR